VVLLAPFSYFGDFWLMAVRSTEFRLRLPQLDW